MIELQNETAVEEIQAVCLPGKSKFPNEMALHFLRFSNQATLFLSFIFWDFPSELVGRFDLLLDSTIFFSPHIPAKQMQPKELGTSIS